MTGVPSPPPRHADPWRLASLALLAAGCAAAIILNAPGHLTYDSVIQLLDGRTGRYHTWHPPAMAWLLGLGDRIHRGTALYVAAQTALFFIALGVVVWTAPRAGPVTLAVVLAIVLTPLTLVWQGIVWKDVLYADLLVSAFVVLSLAFSGWPDRWRRRALIGLAFALAALAALVRQNGAVALVVMGFTVAVEAWPRGGGARASARVALIATGLTAAPLAAMLAANTALATRSLDGDGPAAEVSILQAYDITGVVARNPGISLYRLPPSLAAEIRRTARTLYSPLRVDPLMADPAWDEGVSDAPGAVAAQWRTIILGHPIAWLGHRLAVFRQIALTPDIVQCRAASTGVDGPPAELKALGLSPRDTPRDAALGRYSARFYGTPVYAHLTYALVALGAIALLLRRQRPGDASIAGMLTAGLLFAASFAAIGVSCDYRYLYALDLAAMTAVLYLAPMLQSAVRGAERRRMKG